MDQLFGFQGTDSITEIPSINQPELKAKIIKAILSRQSKGILSECKLTSNKQEPNQLEYL